MRIFIWVVVVATLTLYIARSCAEQQLIGSTRPLVWMLRKRIQRPTLRHRPETSYSNRDNFLYVRYCCSRFKKWEKTENSIQYCNWMWWFFLCKKQALPFRSDFLFQLTTRAKSILQQELVKCIALTVEGSNIMAWPNWNDLIMQFLFRLLHDDDW